jgi:hypothetical protein
MNKVFLALQVSDIILIESCIQPQKMQFIHRLSVQFVNWFENCLELPTNTSQWLLWSQLPKKMIEIKNIVLVVKLYNKTNILHVRNLCKPLKFLFMEFSSSYDGLLCMFQTILFTLEIPVWTSPKFLAI